MGRTSPISRRVHSVLSVLGRVVRLPIVSVSLLLAAVLQADAQDKQALISEALSAAPPEVAKTAIVKNWDGTVLRPGAGAYTCFPTRDSMKKRGKMHRNRFGSSTRSDPFVSSLATPIMIPNSDSPVKGSRMPNQLLGVRLHTMACSGLPACEPIPLHW
jgi:hypothetical protein